MAHSTSFALVMMACACILVVCLFFLFKVNPYISDDDDIPDDTDTK